MLYEVITPSKSMTAALTLTERTIANIAVKIVFFMILTFLGPVFMVAATKCHAYTMPEKYVSVFQSVRKGVVLCC